MSAVATAEIIDAFYVCLAASVIWAPLVFLGAAFVNRQSGGRAEDAVWPSALVIAALPVIAAPVAAMFGLSLRAAKPLPPLAAPDAVAIAAPTAIVNTAPTGSAVELATILNAAADLYFYGFILFAALGVLRLVGFSYRVRYSYAIDDARLMDGLREWRRAMGVRTPVRFAYCDAVTSVCVHGFIRPVVLMPPTLLERVSPSDATLMGAHELAHIKRGDTWLFASCGLIKALFWFNPFMRRIVAHAQLAAEQGADALVIRSGVSRKSYARCFVESLKISAGLSSPQHALVPSFTPFDKRSRRERLNAILSGRAAAPVLTLGGKIILIASGLTALTLAFGQAALAVAPPPAKDALTVIPVEGRISSTFGERFDPITEERKFHNGMDIAAPTGTPVRAAGAGKVIDATARYQGNPAWGNVVVIDHGHGLVTRYAQLDSYIVRKGDTVEAGDTIAAVGASGRATGPHLHFEVLADGEPIDPAPVVTPDAPAPQTLAPQTPRIMKKVMLAPFAPEILAAPAARAAAAGIVHEPTPLIEPETPAAPAPALAPEVPPELDALSLGERFELRLADSVEEWRANFEDGFADVEFLDGMTVRFGDMEVTGDDIQQTIESAMRQFEFDGEDWDAFTDDLPRFVAVIDGEKLTNDQRREIERAAKRAHRAAIRATARAKREIERANIDQKRVMAELERAVRGRERAAQQVERANRHNRHSEDIDEDHAERLEDMLERREEALQEAAEELEEERAELARMRAELRDELRAEKRKKD